MEKCKLQFVLIQLLPQVACTCLGSAATFLSAVGIMDVVIMPAALRRHMKSEVHEALDGGHRDTESPKYFRFCNAKVLCSLPDKVAA